MNIKRIERWRDFLNEQNAHFEKSGAVHPLSADPSLFYDSMIAEALLQRDNLEGAIKQFASGGTWPELDAEQTVYLQHRLLNARVVLDQVLLRPAIYATFKPSPPSTRNHAAFLHWLLITVWNISGPPYLKAWADDYMKKHPPETWVPTTEGPTLDQLPPLPTDQTP